MKPSVAAGKAAEALRNNRLVALIGAGASARSEDENGVVYKGLPLPSQFVEQVSKNRATSYVAADMDFTAACEAVVKHDNRAMLEEMLVKTYGRPSNAQAPPAHKLLAWLPFKMYISSNYDQFLENELERSNKPVAVLIENEDVAKVRREAVPLVKYHGCVSRPSTMVATPADHVRVVEQARLLRQYIAVSLANSSLLVVGHGLGDEDLTELLLELVGDLDEYAPAIFVIREPGASDGNLPVPYDHQVVTEDLTRFLSRVLHEVRAGQAPSASAPVFDEAWLSSPFFAQLRQASVLPSETQVIDAFLNHLADELRARSEVGSVLDDATSAVDRALDDRPNYAALRRTWDAITESLKDVGEDVPAAEDIVDRLIQAREEKKVLFGNLGRRVIRRQDRLLVFSQSQRVIQTLLGVNKGIQRTCEVFVAECRPKSPSPYDDAAAICRELRQSSYDVAVCPDVVAINLLANRQVDRVLLGTHAIYVDDRGQYAFVNTCGSLAIALAAEKYGVAVTVIGEELKVESVPREDAADHLFSHQEENLLASATGLVELTTQRGPVGHTNIGYDLVPFTSNMTIEVPDVVEDS